MAVTRSDTADADPSTRKVKVSVNGVETEVSIQELRNAKKVWGYHKERKPTDLEQIFKEDILEKEIGLNETTSEEVF